MNKVTNTANRKADHIRINLDEDVGSKLTTGLENFRFQHDAVPEINFDQIDLSQDLFGKQIQYPILISSMTGGTQEASRINHNLAAAAQATQIAMGVGSQRAALEKPELAASFQVRSSAPDILLFANLGAVQLNYGYSADDCQRAVDMIEADALILHFNAIQEAVQPEGDTNFRGLLDKIAKVTQSLEVPIIAKEVGWGFSGKTAKKLVDVGISAIDVAGAGGTSWSQVEMHRAESESQARLAAQFIGWGIPTADAILQVHQATPETPIIASGGLRTGLDIAKCIALGAVAGGMASPFLKAAADSQEAVFDLIQETSNIIQTVMFGVGAANLDQLRQPDNLIEVYRHAA